MTGAGCSYDAGIPISKTMVNDLEKLLKSHIDWKEYSLFYDLVKSAILYSDGIQGKQYDNFDIERLVNVLSELEKRENNPIYPFVGGWIPRLLETAGYEFQKKCERFRHLILEQLKQWVNLRDTGQSEYYGNLFNFQNQYQYALRIFSLNYDLCIEKNIPSGKSLERGFDRTDRLWSWKPFEPPMDEPNIYLYKLHGSIDWERQDDRLRLKELDTTSPNPDLIFGTDYKMQYIDPYLFYFYEFRKYSLEAKVIVSIGYSFRDQHINGILTQALRMDANRRIIIVSPDADKILQRVESPTEQYIPVMKTAKEFLETFTISNLESLITS